MELKEYQQKQAPVELEVLYSSYQSIYNNLKTVKISEVCHALCQCIDLEEARITAVLYVLYRLDILPQRVLFIADTDDLNAIELPDGTVYHPCQFKVGDKAINLEDIFR